MKKYISLFMVTLFLGLFACDNYVDIDPRANALAESLEDVDLLLNNGADLNTLGLGANSIPALINDNIRITSNEVDVLKSDQSGLPFAQIYELETLFYNSSQNDLVWQTYYNQIGVVNYALQVLEPLENSQKKNELTGDALIHRALSYFKLVNIYGPHFGLPEADNANSGVPLITVFGDITVQVPRNTVNEVYEFILNDINTAIPLLPQNSPTPSRPNKAAGYGLLAEVLLHTGDYENALLNAEIALSFKSDLLNYNTELLAGLPENIENKESIFLKETVVESFFNSSTFNTVVFGTYSEELLAISDVDNDLRVSLLLERDFISDNLQLPNFTPLQIGVTVPNLLLIQAECLARTGDITAAIDVVNELRANRFDADFVAEGGHLLTVSNQENALEQIINERRREFNVWGRRFFDIKRLNAIENANISLVRDGVTFAPNSINWAAPIATNVINSSNGQIVQNPRE
ncbi:RagB/SusD family nutrient uptake outer membrane protein [Maribacter sp. 2210JD10-5]|uniref:RagB/SusD family nutrient uptake outer membrane protein n=1 Tax=Maribacter sp. 2210JD10-5 TaxID=3386272 RepID=UPI0039BD7D4A